MFNGVAYDEAFNEAAKKALADHYVPEFDNEGLYCSSVSSIEKSIDLQLRIIEWTLWGTIKNTLYYFSIMLSLSLVVITRYLMDVEYSFITAAISLAFIVTLSASLYWLLRFAFYLSLTRHKTGRKFGEDWIKE